jgi:hypothetical protein
MRPKPARFHRVAASAAATLLALASPDAEAQAGPGRDMFTIAAPADPAEPPPPPPPPGPVHRWEINGSLSGAFNSYTSMSIPYASGNQFTGVLGVTHYLQPLVDDGAPRSLEPYLQRMSTLSLSANAGGWTTNQSNPTTFSFGDTYGGVSAGFNVYATPVLAFTGSFAYGYDVARADMRPDQASHSFAGSGGIGLRFGDTRVDGWYTFSARDTSGTFAPLRWGTATLSVTTVIARSFYGYAWGQALQSGGGGGLQLVFHPNRDLDIYAEGFGKRGEIFNNADVIAERFGATGGVAYWVSPSVRLEAAYDFTYTEQDDQTIGQVAYYPYTQLTHGFTLAAAVRLP